MHAIRIFSGHMGVNALILIGLITGAAWGDDLITRDGKTYHDYKVISHNEGFVTILYANGGGKIPLSDLPDALQKQYHYDAKKASAVVEQETRAEEKQALTVAEAQTAESNRKEAEVKMSSEVQATEQTLHVEVAQVLPDGLLASLLAMPSDGRAIDFSRGEANYSPTGRTIFIKSNFKGTIDDERLLIKAIRDGSYSYVDTIGARRTIEKWVAIEGWAL